MNYRDVNDLGLKCDLNCHSSSQVQITVMAHSRHRASKPVASRDEGSSHGICDSEAETDQSSASRNRDSSEHFWRLALSKYEEEQETAYGIETLQQKSDSNDAKLNLDTNQSPVSEHKDGEWLKDHPWENETPRRQDRMETRMDMSQVCIVPDKWLASKTVDLERIYSSLPKFIDEIKGPSIRQELDEVLQIDPSSLKIPKLLKAIESTNAKLSPHVLEIAQKQNKVPPQDQPSLRDHGNKNTFKAFSLTPPQKIWFFDCEYMLKMCLPDDSLQWFKNNDQQGRHIREINPEKKDKRWIFIPSFRRAKIALLDWPQDNIVTQESTIRLLVVRPSEFEEYTSCCGHKFPIICLPEDEIGAGYPRYWIQKITLRLKLHFIWMIDDSVECFYEYAPPPCNRDLYKPRKFGPVFERIENSVKATNDESLPIAAMSPRRFMSWETKPRLPFDCKPPQSAVFLNLAALKSKEVYYRPELRVLEDMIFGYECEKNGLKVFIDNHIHLQDHDWQDTGARSPSVQQKPT